VLFFSYSVVNFIRFLCLYVGALLCGVPNDAACFVAFWQTVSNVWQFVRSVIGRPSAMFGNLFAALLADRQQP